MYLGPVADEYCDAFGFDQELIPCTSMGRGMVLIHSKVLSETQICPKFVERVFRFDLHRQKEKRKVRTGSRIQRKTDPFSRITLDRSHRVSKPAKATPIDPRATI